MEPIGRRCEDLEIICCVQIACMIESNSLEKWYHRSHKSNKSKLLTAVLFKILQKELYHGKKLQSRKLDIFSSKHRSVAAHHSVVFNKVNGVVNM